MTNGSNLSNAKLSAIYSGPPGVMTFIDVYYQLFEYALTLMDGLQEGHQACLASAVSKGSLLEAFWGLQPN